MTGDRAVMADRVVTDVSMATIVDRVAMDHVTSDHGNHPLLR